VAVYATWDDVNATFEGTIPAEAQPRIDTLLRQASARLAAMVPSIDARLAAGTLDPELPSSVVVEAVLRVYRNPIGAQQQSVGPFNLSFQGGQKGGLYLDPDVVNALLSPEVGQSPGVGSFRVARACPESPVRTLDGDW